MYVAKRNFALVIFIGFLYGCSAGDYYTKTTHEEKSESYVRDYYGDQFKIEGPRQCRQGLCNWLSNDKTVRQDPPLFFKDPSVECIPYRGDQKDCTSNHVRYELLINHPHEVKYRITDNLASARGLNHYRIRAKIYRENTKLVVVESPIVKYKYGKKFTIAVPNGAVSLEVIGNSKKHGPFSFEPKNFTSGFGLKLVERIPGEIETKYVYITE